MDLNELMFRRCFRDNDEDLIWGRLLSVLGFRVLNRSLPVHLVEDIIWKHLESQPLGRLFELRLVSKWFQKFLTDPDSLRRHRIHESFLIKENCVQNLGCQHRGNGNDRWGAEDVLQGRVIPIPIPSSPTTPLCRYPMCMGSRWSSLDGWSVSSGHGGEPGLIYLQRRRASASASNSRIRSPSITEWVALNPVTKSLKHLPRACLGKVPNLHYLWSVDRFGSAYVSWASDGGDKMYPLLLDSLSNAWKRIGFGFKTSNRIRVDKAAHNGVVYLRYEKQNLKHLLIVYNVLQGSFCEKNTTGLPDNISEELIFHYAGHIYLAAVVGSRLEKNVVVYELESSKLNWVAISIMSSELINFHPALSELKFFYIDHELVVASSVTKRRTDGIHIYLSDRSTCATVSYDLTKRSWRKDEPARLPSVFDFRTTRTSVFKPSTHIEA